MATLTTTKSKVAAVAVGAAVAIASLVGVAVVTRTGTTGQTQHGYVTESGKRYDIIEQNPAAYPNYVPPCAPDLNCRHAPLETLVTNTGCADATGCFKFQGYPVDAANCSASNHCPNDRLEIRLSDLDESTGLHFGLWRYEKFSVRFDPSTTIAPPNNPRAIIAQVWQNTTTLLGPPLEVTAADAGANVRLDFNFKADATGPYHTLYSTLVPKSDTDFTTLCWKMKPSASGPRGAMFIWSGADCAGNIDLLPLTSAVNYNADDNGGGLCATLPASWTAACLTANHMFFNWGYTTAAGGFDQFRISVGMYRPPTMQTMLFWMDNIGLATSAAGLQ